MTSFSPEPEFWIEDAPYDAEGEVWSDDGWGGGGGDDGGGPPEDPAPPKSSRRWPRWAALGVGLAVIAGIVFWQSRVNKAPDSADLVIQDSTPTVTAPTTDRPVPTSEPAASSEAFELSTGSGSDPNTRLPTTAGVVAQDLTDPSVLKETTWELIGYGPDGVLRYTPATGRLVHTPVPGISSGGPMSVVFTDDAAVIRPYDSVTGYVVRDGDVAEPLAGKLAGGGPALPGPDPEHVWVIAVSYGGAVNVQGDSDSGTTYTLNPQDLTLHAQLVLVDLDGTPTGAVIDIPDTGGINPSYQVRPDGAGYAFLDWVGGTYHLGVDGTRLVTHGQLLATGPATVLLNECDDTAVCSGVVVDRMTGEHRPLPGLSIPNAYTTDAITSPDGRWAAILDPSSSTVSLVDLRSGATTTPYRNADPFTYGTTPTMAFSPDGRYLLVARMAGVAVIDSASGLSLGMLPAPNLTALAVRPAG